MGDRSIARTFLFTMGVLGGSLALLGCPKEAEVSQATSVGAVSPASPGPAVTQAKAPARAEVVPPRATALAEQALPPSPAVPTSAPAPQVLKDVFFDFDDALIRGDQKPALTDDIAWLRAHSQVKVTIEGYCDERGTEEYNLALGQRRAQAVKDSLMAGGVSADRITTISYGKERPFALGHDENAWRLNRRDHFVASGGSTIPRASISPGAEGAQAASR